MRAVVSGSERGASGAPRSSAPLQPPPLRESSINAMEMRAPPPPPAAKRALPANPPVLTISLPYNRGPPYLPTPQHTHAHFLSFLRSSPHYPLRVCARARLPACLRSLGGPGCSEPSPHNTAQSRCLPALPACLPVCKCAFPDNPPACRRRRPPKGFTAGPRSSARQRARWRLLRRPVVCVVVRLASLSPGLRCRRR